MKTYEVFPALTESDVANIQVGNTFHVQATENLVKFSENLDFTLVSLFVIRATFKEVDDVHAFVSGVVEEPEDDSVKHATLTVSWLNKSDYRSILDVK
jgi:hypothetical protein